MPCEKPKCYRTKTDKCIYPNSWIVFLQKNAGRGLSKSDLKIQYAAWKRDNFPSNSTVISRRDVLCDQLESAPIIRRKKTSSKKSSRGTKHGRGGEPIQTLDSYLLEQNERKVRARIRELVKMDVEQHKEEARILRGRIIEDENERENILLLRRKRAARIIGKRLIKRANQIRTKNRNRENRKRHDAQTDIAIGIRSSVAASICRRSDILIGAVRNHSSMSGFSESQPPRNNRQRAVQAAQVNRAEQANNNLEVSNSRAENIMKCRIGNDHFDQILNGYFPVLPVKQPAETICLYMNRAFRMDHVFVTQYLEQRERFLIYSGSTVNADQLYVKISSITKLNELKSFRYRTHVQKEVMRIFTNENGQNTIEFPVLVHSSISLLSNRPHVSSVESVVTIPGETVSHYLLNNMSLHGNIMANLGKILGKMHSKRVVHGDCHLGNWMYNSLNSKITPIDLERGIIFGTGSRNNDSLNIGMEFDFISLFRDFVGTLREKEGKYKGWTNRKKYEKIFDRFTAGYTGKNVSDLTDRDRHWKTLELKYLRTRQSTQDSRIIRLIEYDGHIQAGDHGITYRALYHPILSNTIEDHWDNVKNLPENNVSFPRTRPRQSPSASPDQRSHIRPRHR